MLEMYEYVQEKSSLRGLGVNIPFRRIIPLKKSISSLTDQVTSKHSLSGELR